MLEELKQGFANFGKYREEDLNKLAKLHAQIDENQKTYATKMDSLEKFVVSIKDAREKEASQPRPQNHFEVSTNVVEQLQGIRNSSESMTYKIETIKYDLELIKEDIVRQKANQKDYFYKVDQLERRFDSLPLGNQSVNGAKGFGISTNFMNNASKMTESAHEDIGVNRFAHDDQKSTGSNKSSTQTGSTTPGIQQQQSLHKNYIDDELEKEFGSNRFDFGGNLSIIDKLDRRFLYNIRAKCTV